MLEMKDFGPLLVTMDSYGRSLYDELGIEKISRRSMRKKGLIRKDIRS